MRRRASARVVAAVLLTSCNGTGSSVQPSGAAYPERPAAIAQVIREFHMPATLLGGLTFGSDGNVYFSTTTQLGIFSPPNATVTLTAMVRRPDTWPVVPKGLAPSGAVSGASGIVSALAVESTPTPAPSGISAEVGSPYKKPAIVQYVIATKTFTEKYSTYGNVFEDLAMTYDGAAWATGDAPLKSGFVGYIFTTKAGFRSPAFSDALGSITVGTDGFLYIATDPRLNQSTTSKIFRVDPADGELTNTYRLPAGSFVTSLTSGPDGALWFADDGFNAIGRLAANGTVRYFAVPTPASGLASITNGCDGALWFTERRASRIGRITTDGSVSDRPTPTQPSYPGDIEGCFDNAIFFTELHAIGQITSQ